jgi:hypothetical protein
MTCCIHWFNDNSNKNNSIIPLFIVTEEAIKDIHFSYLESVTNIYESN